MLSQTRENSCHQLSHGDYTWRTPVLAGLKSSLLTETRCYPLVAHPTEVITSKSFYPLFSWTIPGIITTHVCFPLSDSPSVFLLCLSTRLFAHLFAHLQAEDRIWMRKQLSVNEPSVHCPWHKNVEVFVNEKGIMHPCSSGLWDYWNYKIMFIA